MGTTPPKWQSPDGEAPVAASPESHIPATTVRSQLERLEASPQFRTSKRCRILLHHVVECYLGGNLDRVKERVIGSEVFGRDPGYDTNQDSVVRTTAAEVRKRLAQYYMEAGHEDEMRVLLPQGSYVPEFRLETPPAPIPQPPRRRTSWLLVALAPLILLGIWWAARARPQELDLFWKPLVDDSAGAVLCIGQPLRIYTFDGSESDDLNRKMVGDGIAPPPADEVRRLTTIPLSDLKPSGNRYFSFGDVMVSVRVGELLARKGKPFQILGDKMANYSDLRGRPAILIGQFNNRWTLGLTSKLRFYIEKDNDRHVYEVRDRWNPGKPVAIASQSASRPQDYALVTRVQDPSTEKTIIVVAGMTYTGTIAGGDFLTNPAYMQQAFAKAPNSWWKKNVQVVLETTPVGGTAGPPRVIAMHFWQ